jgi:hypothetical protein
MEEPGFTIFISHAAVDEEIARTIKEYLGRAFLGQRIFVSSDPEDLKPGNEWVQKIRRYAGFGAERVCVGSHYRAGPRQKVGVV